MLTSLAATTIVTAGLSNAGKAVLVVVYVAVASEASRALLARMTEWIMANLRMIEIVVGICFGVYFLAKGLAVLV